jgi:hypothetical protein
LSCGKDTRALHFTDILPPPVLNARMKGLSILVMNNVRLRENKQLNFSIFRTPNKKSTKEAIDVLSNFTCLEISEVVGMKKHLFSAIYSFPTTSSFHRHLSLDSDYT